MGRIQNEKIAEFCGAMIGDGWIQSNEKSLFLTGDPIEDKDYYDEHMSQMVSDILVSVKPKNFPYWKVYGISIHQKKIIRDMLLNFDLPKGKKSETAKIPRWIINSDPNIKKSFIRGFFDTDGGVFCQKDYTKYADEFNSKYHVKLRLRMSSISEELISQICGFLRHLNFRFTKRTVKGGFRGNRNYKDTHIIEINALRDLDRFFKEIKPKNKRHLTRYGIWKKFGFCPPKTTIIQRKEILKRNLDPYLFYKQE